ncbi:MAG: hypothetical protein ABI383_11090 [Acidobacteriaceae bacterium]
MPVTRTRHRIDPNSRKEHLVNKRNWIATARILAWLLLLACTAFGIDIPVFDAHKPLAPEDPSLLLAGIGGAGIALAYLRCKFRK